MKKVLLVVLSAIVMFSLVACSPPASQESASDQPSDSESETSAESESIPAGEKDKYVIGVTSPNQENEANAIWAEAMIEYAKELGNVEVIVTDGGGLAENQVAQCETFVTQGVDAVIISPYDAEGCIPAAQACIDGGVPAITSKVEISDQSLVQSYVGANDFDGGAMEMEHMAEALGGKGNIVILEGPTSISAAILRMEGINSVLKNYPDIKILYSQPADWMRDLAMQTMENWLQLGEQIDGVVAHNDEMALGAYDAIKDAGLEKEIKVIGLDAIPAALESVKSGELIATVLQANEEIGRKAVDIALMLAKGEKVEETYYIPFVLITQDNVGDYL
jgi:ABC-type sugar transport system substrate-binding protein